MPVCTRPRGSVSTRRVSAGSSSSSRRSPRDWETIALTCGRYRGCAVASGRRSASQRARPRSSVRSVSTHSALPSSSSRPPTRRNSVARDTPSSSASPACRAAGRRAPSGPPRYPRGRAVAAPARRRTENRSLAEHRRAVRSGITVRRGRPGGLAGRVEHAVDDSLRHRPVRRQERVGEIAGAAYDDAARVGELAEALDAVVPAASRSGRCHRSPATAARPAPRRR